ncbi:MAG: hypothetical protein GX163_04860 [Bacteroidetes bacterium]|jgi:hypothetical protein|nr:hypothetical protein [Bacteroidota bacterium]
MKNLFNFFALILFTAFFIAGCTRDDLCPENTGVTPNISILFHNSQEPDLRKSVENLKILVDDESQTVAFSPATTDSISLPLNVNSDQTDFIFEKIVTSETDTLIYQNHLSFSYNRKDIYVNRACGFRSEFYDLNVSNRAGNLSWIDAITVKKDSITNENEAHLIIYH